MEMDVLEEIETNENQISFDFLTETPKTVEQAENFDWVADETLVLIVKSNKFLSFDFDLCGKKLCDWVSLATSGCKQKFIDDFEEEDVIEIAKSHSENYKFVAVLFSDAPLLKKSTFLEIMDYFSKNRMNVLKLSRGYVFKGEYLQTAKILLSSTVEEFDKEDFTVLDSAEKVSYAFKVLNNRILNYHKKNGVILFGESTIFIDADVEIEAGAIVYPNNVLKGESYIGKNAVLESGNYILDTIVCDEAFVCQSYLEKSKVEQGKVVGPFAKLINEKI